MNRLLLACTLATACATARPAAYSETCRDPARMCAFSYDFEPSGAATDPFAPADGQPRYLVANEDALLFHWTLATGDEWEHATVRFATSLAHVMTKVESAASGVCDGVPVLLAASNFMPGRSGRSPMRERVVAVVGALDAPSRILEVTSQVVASIAAREGQDAAKIEGLALSPDCRTLYVGVRSVGRHGQESMRDKVYPIALDIDWQGTRESATLGEPIVLGTVGTCSGFDEGVSALEVLPDGSLAVLTSFEVERVAKNAPTEVPQGELAGSLWRRSPDGEVSRLACFPGHKPEALVALPDGSGVRVIAEDDEYGGRPMRAWAVGIDFD